MKLVHVRTINTYTSRCRALYLELQAVRQYGDINLDINDVPSWMSGVGRVRTAARNSFMGS